MRSLIVLLFCALAFNGAFAQEDELNVGSLEVDFENILSDLSNYYIYLEDKGIDLDCIRQAYQERASQATNLVDQILFFEYLLDEFYDSHLILNTNTNSSYRLWAPIYAGLKDGKPIITNIWQSQIANLNQNILGAEIIAINDLSIDDAIEAFPTQCQDKGKPEIREWIINKLLAGRYDQDRILRLKLPHQEVVSFDLDELQIIPQTSLLSIEVTDNIGIIRIHNSLGNNDLIAAFDEALSQLTETDGLIIDLRNTVDGGNSYVARGIMSRFITKEKPYQKHWTKEQYDQGPALERSWIEYVSPRGNKYQKPVIVLVGRWTGSMGEGLAIGFEGMERGQIVGTEMRRLAGEVFDYGFKNQWYGYKLSTRKLFHLNGTIREAYIPTHYV
ncbi:MAG: S41 family peptidase, partial [Bacteroidota bacterium]